MTTTGVENIEAVSFEEAGLSADGKRLFSPKQAFHIPEEVEPLDKSSCGSHGERFIKEDEFGIARPSQDWKLELYKSL